VDRRDILKKLALATGGLMLSGIQLQAKTFLTVDQAKRALWGDIQLQSMPVRLTKDQVKSIKEISKVRVNYPDMRTWRTPDGGWFILDKVIGKHENIDCAVAITNQGKIKGIEILVYRESYGHQVRNPKWLAQFFGRNNSEHLKLDKQIKNISGATLSCRHITDAINRLTHTWDQVLRNVS
jgi:Na+-translocating ferredoxin:NAD+ oxidoreductase RnfG subunit